MARGHQLQWRANFLRDVATSGYARAVGDVVTPDWIAATKIQGKDKPGSLGQKYVNIAHTRLSPLSLRRRDRCDCKSKNRLRYL